MLKRNLLANLLGQGWASLAGFIFVPYYIGYLGVEAYGVIGFYAVLQNILTIVDFGMTPTLSRNVARIRSDEDCTATGDLLRSIELSFLSFGILIAGSVWLLAQWLSTSWLDVRTLSVATVAQAVAVMGFLAAVRLIEGPYRGILVGRQRHVLLNLLISGFATLRGVGAILVLAYYEATIEAFFLWQLATGIFQLICFALCAYATLPRGARHGRFSLGALRSVWAFAGAMFAFSIAGLILVNADKVLLSKLLPLSEFGYYMLASLAASALYTIIYPIRQTWSPRLNQLHAAGDETSFTEAYHRACSLISVVAGSIAFFLMAFADVVLAFWTRDATITAQTTAILRVLLLGNLLNGLVNIPTEAQFAFRWTRLALITELISICLIFPALLVMTPRFGMLGAGWSLVALNLLYLGVVAGPMYRHILRSERWRWMLGDVLLPLGTAAVFAFTSRYVFSLCPLGSPVSWAVFLGGAAMTLAVTALATPVTREDGFHLVRIALRPFHA